MLVLVIGPSGVGKSSTLRFAANIVPAWAFASLDRLARNRARALELIGRKDEVDVLRRRLADDARFLAFGIDAVNEFIGATPSRHQVIDVGAAFLEAPGSSAWLAQHSLITLIAPAAVIHRRMQAIRGDLRSLDQYVAKEFSAVRTALYQQTHRIIDADCAGVEQLTMRLIGSLTEILGTPPSSDPAG